MKLTQLAQGIGFAAATASPVLADPGDGWHDGFGHMMRGGGYGLFGSLMMIAFWGIIIALIVFVVRRYNDGNGSKSRDGAMDILRERFAKGEIDEEEFTRRKKAMES